MSQKTEILTHLETGASITPIEALMQYGIFRLADVIFKLREDGHDITTDTIKTKQKQYASYRLEETK